MCRQRVFFYQKGALGITKHEDCELARNDFNIKVDLIEYEEHDAFLPVHYCIDSCSGLLCIE
jgi:hypothetical protein